jgi:hypothetical protein
MPPPTIYKLKPIMDDPRYEGFGSASRSLVGNDAWAQDFLPDEDGRPPRLADVWRPAKVDGRVRSFNDYPCVDSVPAFSERAVEALRDLLEKNGELLPLSSELGRYYAYNVTTVADVLDRKKADAVYSADGRSAMWIKRYAFCASRLKGLTIFRIPEDDWAPYVTDEFVARAEQHGLDGLDFAKVWPLPGGVDWESAHKRQRRRRERKELPKGSRLKGQSVFVRLGLRGKRPEKAECKLRDRLVDELDAMLVDPRSKSPSVGSLEGHQCLGGVCELRLSCPDAAALARKLAPWLNAQPWPGEVTAVKRDRGFDNLEANETPVKLRRTSMR